jgi:hypothetical protein
MPPRTPQQIADAFRGFVPDDRFRKFVRTLNTTGRSKRRLLAWQDALWKQFAATRTDAPRSFDEIADALRVCPVHLVRMSPEEVPIAYGLWHFSPEQVRALQDTFPFANYMVFGPDWHEPQATDVVPVCPACRQALDEWNARRKHPFGRPPGGGMTNRSLPD